MNGFAGVRDKENGVHPPLLRWGAGRINQGGSTLRQRLEIPYLWEDRVPLLKDRLFYIPQHYEAHCRSVFPPWSSLFGNIHHVHIEYCSGNGEWILEKAATHPHLNWVAVDWNFRRIQKIYAKRKSRGLKNVFIVFGESFTFTREYVPSESVEALYINFPDPWPKRRHAKHRLIHSPFVQELSRILLPFGTLHLVTDHADYGQQMRFMLDALHQWKWTEPDDLADYGTSYFARLWQSKGRSIYSLRYQKWPSEDKKPFTHFAESLPIKKSDQTL